MPQRPSPYEWRLIRDVILFAGGLIGVVHETFWTNFDRPALLVLYAAMMGLPAFLRNGVSNGEVNDAKRKI